MTALPSATGSDGSVPQHFDEYRLVRVLGRGSMGVVFLGHDTVLDRPVAIKFIGGHEVSARTRERFLTEARAAARLLHPNVMAIHRIGELEGRLYIVGARGQAGPGRRDLPRSHAQARLVDRPRRPELHRVQHPGLHRRRAGRGRRPARRTERRAAARPLPSARGRCYPRATCASA